MLARQAAAWLLAAPAASARVAAAAPPTIQLHARLTSSSARPCCSRRRRLADVSTHRSSIGSQGRAAAAQRSSQWQLAWRSSAQHHVQYRGLHTSPTSSSADGRHQHQQSPAPPHQDGAAAESANSTGALKSSTISSLRRLELQLASIRKALQSGRLSPSVISAALLSSSGPGRSRLSRALLGEHPSRARRALVYALAILLLLAALYQFSTTFRRLVIAAKRCSVVAAVVAGVIVDYKLLFRKEWPDTDEGRQQRHEDYEATHKRSAERVRAACIANGGIYIKLGQHLSSVQLIPPAWSETFIPLQDQCTPTPLPELQALFLHDVGAPLSSLFSSFDPEPIGTASLAQVHIATDRQSGRKVAVKVMHPDLEEFAAVDMQTTVFMLKVVKSVFPTFEFTWLGEEMQENLPLEMDFRHEAANAARCARDFAHLKRTSLVVPEVLWAKKRVLVMEYIAGSRIDNLEYLAAHSIDRNRVSQELSHIMSQMIYLNGFFHGDPHGGNLLVRPAQKHSRSKWNFEIVLLDHGLYFDMPSDLRLDYAHLWLSLIAPSSPAVEEDRRKYAKLVGNINDDLFPIFQAAITGRAALQGSTAEGDEVNDRDNESRASSMLEMGQMTREEQHMMRNAVVTDGLVEAIFRLLRGVPRRMLMVLKVNDLTRALDSSLQTTHGVSRIFLIVAHYCARAIYDARLNDLAADYNTWLSPGYIWQSMAAWVAYQRWNFGLWIVELGSDIKADAIKAQSAWHALWRASVSRRSQKPSNEAGISEAG